TLQHDFQGSGAGIPIHWQHKDDKPTDIIGETLSAVEDEHGLLVTARLDLDLPEGKRAYDLLKRGLIHQMSIGFIAEETAFVQDGKSSWDGYREIRQLKLFEISLVQVAANQGAEVLEVKSGRAISASNESKLRAALDSLHEVLDGIDSADKKPDDDTDDSMDDSSGQPDDSTDDPKRKNQKSFDPQWAEEYKTISDFFSLEH
ncbi:peptidase, partial [Bifidobacterium pseudocatenulatum]